MADDTLSPTRRVALGAIGVATVAAAAAVVSRQVAAPEPAGGAIGPTPTQDRPTLRATIEAELKAQTPSAPVTQAAVRPAGLEQRAVLAGSPDRRVLYTWTTTAQIDALRAGGKLLHRKRSARGGRSRFDRAIRTTPKRPIVRHLTAPDLAFRRFAWPYPWATLLGWPGEQYGNQLLRVELKPCQTAICRVTCKENFYDTMTMERTLTDVKLRWRRDRPVEKVGAVFHDHMAAGQGTPMRVALREYVLFKPAMIAGFSHGDARCLAAIRADLAFLDDLLTRTPKFLARTLPSRWPIRVRSEAEAFIANLAFLNPNYRPDVANLKRARDALAAALDAQGPALVR